jgi:drug/metabolite transporter (DMT)-like permease
MTPGMTITGIQAALLSAVLFGMSPAVCKLAVGDMEPALLAGLLYLGSGLGLAGAVLLRGVPVRETFSGFTPRQWTHLLGAIVSGGIAAPLLLAFGILNGTASEVSLLLNFEAVATTLIAWALFHEQVGRRVWAGKAVIIVASILIVFRGEAVRLSLPGLAVLAACVLWGVDNNLTRELESVPATLLACIKGLAAGGFNLLLSFLMFDQLQFTLTGAAGALAIGAFSYGASLVLFIHALREIGSARTSTWFASGPFIGGGLSILLLHERPPAHYWLSAILMLSGMFFLYGERHRHLHRHERMEHSHPHEHDEHHRHPHDLQETVPHEHFHVHEPISHSHLHWPDIHHRHRH